MNVGFYKLPFANLILNWDENLKIKGIRLANSDVKKSKKSHPVFDAWLAKYLKGGKDPFPIEHLDFGYATEFQKSVYKALWQIPRGQTKTYSQIAQAIKKPLACRAVGNANGKNPFLLVIPCHRVVATLGLGGFACGVKIKENMLRFEEAL